MELEFKADGPADEPELFIHLDIDGLAALLRAIEAAMRTGHGQLSSDAFGAGGTIVGSGSPGAFKKVTVTFDHPAGKPGPKKPH
ncbi:MAG TPA: hypothetical protein VF650_09390 [Allosphingosinicella sp.]|jgi:hypothetical protein